MLRSPRLRAWVAWGWVALLTVGTAVLLRAAASHGADGGDLAFLLLPPILAAAGALIYIRRPGNAIGWMLFIPAVGGQAGDLISLYLASSAPPAQPGPLTIAALAYSQLSWMTIFFPLLLLPQLFPTGKALGNGWRWLLWLAVAMVATLTFISLFGQEFHFEDWSSWAMPNPVGFVPESLTADGGAFMVLWTLGLVTLALGGLASAIVRYRRATRVERQQIKWLLYAFAIFGIVYVFVVVTAPQTEAWVLLPVINFLLPLAICGIPVAMAVAVLRYRLFDIDVIIRRTVSYTVVVASLTAAYIGLVIGMQRLLPLSGSAPVALSTLVVASLFLPLLRRVQRTVDRRFFRSRYEPGAVVARMAGELRGRLDLDEVVERAAAVLVEVYSPESVSVWVADERV